MDGTFIHSSKAITNLLIFVGFFDWLASCRSTHRARAEIACICLQDICRTAAMTVAYQFTLIAQICLGLLQHMERVHTGSPALTQPLHRLETATFDAPDWFKGAPWEAWPCHSTSTAPLSYESTKDLPPLPETTGHGRTAAMTAAYQFTLIAQVRRRYGLCY